MPGSKQKPSDVASDAKKRFIPYCVQKYPQWRPNSILVAQARRLRPESANSAGSASSVLRVAVIKGDPVDVALEWYEHQKGDNKPIPVINAANERRPGGDWELGLMASEENFCRRSNLVHCLSTPWPGCNQPHYPIPQYGGIYSPNVIVFRDGADRGYDIWPEFKPLPVISVAASRRPKLTEDGNRYSFAAEVEHVRNKIKTILRIAAEHGHRRIVVGSWALGSVYRNPARQLAQIWAELLFHDEEFHNKFTDVVFAFASDCEQRSGGSGSSSSSDKDSSIRDYEIFREEFDPSKFYEKGAKLRANGSAG